MKLLAIPALLAAVFVTAPAQAKLNVFACEPEWGALVTELAGDKVDLEVATTALQDVHVIEAKPSLIAKVRAADLVVCTGAELEIGWLPQLIRQSGNDKVASGAGSFMAASQVKTLERPTALDRANGDVHPQGNPHIQMDPRRVLIVARRLDDRLTGSRERGHLQAARRRLRAALAGGDGEVEATGRAAQGPQRRRPPHQLGVPVGLARDARSRCARTQAGRAADRRAHVAAGRDDEEFEHAGDRARRIP